MYVCVCMYVCMGMYVRMCVCVCMYVCMYVRMYVCTYVCMYIYVCMHVRMCMYVCTYVCVCNVCMYVFFLSLIKHAPSPGSVTTYCNVTSYWYLVIGRGCSVCLCCRCRTVHSLYKVCMYVYVCTRSVNKVMRLIQYNSVFSFKLQIEFVPFKIVPLGGYTPPETLFPLFVAMLVVANRYRF